MAALKAGATTDMTSDVQNSQLQHAINKEDRDVTARDSIPATAPEPTKTNIDDVDTNTAGRNKSKKQSKRSAHGTRGALKRAQVTAIQEGSSASDVAVIAAFERDSTNFSEAMRSDKRDGWIKAMEEEDAALQENSVWKFVKRVPGPNALHNKWVYILRLTRRASLSG